MNNRKGMKASHSAWTVGIVAVLAVVAILAVGGYGPFNTTAVDDNGVPVDGQCAVNPTLSVTALDALSQGTNVSVTTSARVNGHYAGSVPSTLGRGDKVEVLASASNYIDNTIPEFTVQCGANLKTVDVFATDAMTLEIKDDSTSLTDAAAGGASNASAVALGGSDTMRVILTGLDKKSSGDLIYVVELGLSSNVSDVTMSDLNGNKLDEVAVPSFYVATRTSPKITAFKIPAIQNAVEKEYKLTYSANSGKDIFGAVYTTVYSAQDFIDTDGTFKSGIENADGTTKYEDTYDYDFYITQ